MKRLFAKSLPFAAFLLCLSCQTSPQEKNYTQYVDPFIGNADNGHTFPGATVRFGLIQTSPETGFTSWRYCSGYNFEDALIWGFSQTHLNGTGCMDLGDLLVMPVTGNRVREAYNSTFDKATEKAVPGYYSVFLKDMGVNAELTATPHAAVHRYTYQQTDSASLLLNLQHGLTWNPKQYETHVIDSRYEQENEHTITGFVRSSVWVDQDLYFVMQFDRPISSVTELALNEGNKGKKLLFGFDNLKSGDQLQMKVAISTVDVAGAKANLAAEAPTWNFDALRAEADKSWNDLFKRIDVKGTDEQLTNFYTSYYHALIQPNNIADVTGKYRGADNEVYEAKDKIHYSTFSTWDTYRAAHPFYTMVLPDYVGGMVNSMIAQSEQQGFLPIWALWGKENYCMIGNHSVPVIAEAHRKGIQGFDAEKAFQAVKRSLTESHRGSDWETYNRFGYYPTDRMETESVSKTLECSYDDYAAAQFATALGKTEDAAFFSKRAENWKNLFDQETRFARPRYADGRWKTPFNPSDLAHSESIGGDYTEGNAWQYTWHVQHDPAGLMGMFPSKESFLSRLDSLFTVELTQKLADVTGLIGQYAHGNEPSHHVTYLYALAGKPARTQELIRQIFDMHYKAKPDGLCGNDDCGQMSAWYMFNAMGFYPVDPVSGNYVFGAPQLEEVVLNLPNGKTFTVKADQLSEANKYVASIEVNGKPYDKNYIAHEDIVAGGSLVFRMSATPAN